ncbi:CRISPR-associated protein Cse1 [Bifidobacterium sp. UTCIF-37]|uniref:type I-E CRISPR-associated endonuclease Cas1e n=1 Tax=unclassified Bifidobacterium TaxID=2608897 RepID=UPI00215964F7|nr:MULTISPECIES: type I-E CRISPR-associated endonuclease Cas1e [unclassified Bifidobacterium]TPF85699.1 CRISPR-associated protein Cse1 [Bifidobacterium sp. UTCIF-37]TPF88040.1 CRISPR-associated protein Cse1 [Bifidobacterium sp. UTCIF-38]
MNAVPGVRPPSLPSLVRVQDRLTFLYAEHCVVNRADNAVTITDSRGTVHVPAAALSVLMLGPGSNITYAAICLLAESRSTCIWVGERGVRYYCHGASLAQSTRLLEAQARLVSSERSRVKVARRMYAMRFPDEKTDGLTMQQLLGKEGTRVRRAYERESSRTGVSWSGRSYKVTDFDDADEVNKALSAANTALYGVVHAVIVALGCSPGLGFVHARNERSFVYDIADLYKVDITIPLAFDLVADQVADVSTAARRGMRDRMKDGKFLQRCVRDIRSLLLTPEEEKTDHLEVEDITTQLWAGASGYRESGRNYSSEPQPTGDASDGNDTDVYDVYEEFHEEGEW